MFNDDFTSGLANWDVYDSVGHDGKGIRSPVAVTTENGLLVIRGDALGTTGGLKLRDRSQQYGHWIWRLRAPAGSSRYHPVALLWGVGSGSGTNALTGEIDVVECWQSGSRQYNSFSLHYSDGSQQIGGGVAVDMTAWHDYHLLWTPEKISTWIDDQSSYFSTTDRAKFPPGKMEMTVQLDWFPGEWENGPSSTAEMYVDNVQIQTLTEYQSTTPSTTTPPLISLGKPATAFSVERNDPALAPWKAVDGNLTTRWSSAWSEPQWICVDLGASYKISRVQLLWEYSYAASYAVQVSNDRVTWHNVYATTSGDGGTDDLSVSGTGRYVRVFCRKRSSQWGFSLYNLAVYGVRV